MALDRPIFTIYCKYCQEPIHLAEGILVLKHGVFHPNTCHPKYMHDLVAAIEEKIEENREANLRRIGAL
jgi:non-homologous end joining protein Ku